MAGETKAEALGEIDEGRRFERSAAVIDGKLPRSRSRHSNR